MKKVKRRIFNIIESPENGGILSRRFDTSIVVLIVLNLILVVAETFSFPPSVFFVLKIFDILSIVIFTLEYILRLWTADLLFPELSKGKARLKYVFTFMAFVDLIAIVPFYIPFIIPLDLRVLQTLRITRLLRLLKVNRYTDSFSAVGRVFKKRIGQLLSSMVMIILLMIIVSVLMFNVEHDAQPEKFDSAFSGFWWAIATITTVGYGDIYPITILGQILNGIFAFLSVGLIAIPTGIISAGFVEYFESEKTTETTEKDEKCFCPYCGHHLDKR